MGMTADGKIATATRSVSSFGSVNDQRHLYELRARSDAVMTGAGTLRAENADLTGGAEPFLALRKNKRLAPENLRIIVSRGAEFDPSLRIFSQPGGTLILLTTQQASSRQIASLEKRGVQVGRFGQRKVNLVSAVRWLRSEWKVRKLHCEGGAELNQALFAADLIDEIHVTWCPWVFGGATAPTIAEGQGFDSLTAAKQFQLASVIPVGDELFLRFLRDT